MILARKIASNTFIQFASRIISGILGIVVMGVLTRYLGVEKFGYYTTVFSYLFFFASFSDLGLYLITVSDLNKQDDREKFYFSLFVLRIITAFFILLLAVMIVFWFPYPIEVKYGIAIISLATFFSLMIQMQSAYFQVNMKTVITSIAEIVGKVVLFAFILVVVYMNLGFYYVLWVIVLSVFVQFLIPSFYAVSVKKFLNFVLTKRDEYVSIWKNIFKKIWPIALSQIFVLIYFKMDIIFLSVLRPQNLASIEIGIYGVSYKILEVLIAFIPLFMGVVVPLLSKYWKEKKYNMFKETYQNIFDILSFFIIPTVFMGVVFSRQIIDLLAPGFVDSDRVLMILMLAIGIISFTHLPTYTIIVLGKQRDMMKIYLMSAVLAVILYLVFIPMYSYWAAAWITVFIETLIFIFAQSKIKSVISYSVDVNMLFKAGLSSVTMFGVLYFIQLNIFVEFFIGIVIYFILMYFLKAVSLDIVKSVLLKRA